MNFKNLFYALTIFALAACSSDDDPNIPDRNGSKPETKLEITANKSKITPFEVLTVKLSPDVHVMYNNYDSVKFQANGSYWNGSIVIGLPDDEYSDEYEFTDYDLGKHKIEVLGYKDNKIVSRDSVEYEVTRPTGDFFHLKWNQESGTVDRSFNFVGPTKLKINEDYKKLTYVVLGLSYSIKDSKNEYAILRFTPWSHTTYTRGLPDINSIDWSDHEDAGHAARVELEHTFMHEYITSLYGPSQFIYEGDDITQTTLTDEYISRFNYNRDFKGYGYPVEIWTTPTTSICLLQYNDFIGGVNTRGICRVVAEPRK